MRPQVLTISYISRVAVMPSALALTSCGGAGGMLTQQPISISLPISSVTVAQSGPAVIIPIQIESTSETALVMVSGLPGGVQEMYSASDTNPSGTLSFAANASAMTGTFLPTISVFSAGQTAMTQFTLTVTMQ